MHETAFGALIMDVHYLENLLRRVRKGSLAIGDAVRDLKNLPYQDLGFAKVDHHRSLRKGFPEVIFCQGKTPDQVIRIMSEILKRNQNLLATRASVELFKDVKKQIPETRFDEISRMMVIEKKALPRKGLIAVLSAGTADIPVAEEAALTAEVMGNRVNRIFDVGVAGIHRLLDRSRELHKARVLVVVAGMEGALPSVVAGLVNRLVIAVPTSIGYGANFGGAAPLLAMLNSCASGITVMNIDNGFGAGFAASLVNGLGS